MDVVGGKGAVDVVVEWRIVDVVVEGRDVEVVNDEGTEVELATESEASPLRPQEVTAIAIAKAHRAN